MVSDEGASEAGLVAGGEMTLSENRYTRAELNRRLLGWRRFAFLAVLLVIALTGVACVLADRLIPTSGDLRAALALVAALILASWEWEAYRRWSHHRQAALWSARGRIDPEPTRFSIGDDGFRAEYGATSTLVRWPGVSEVFPTARHWLFVGGTLAYCVPRRFFTDTAAEQAFLRAAFGRMNPEARARSPEAGAFIGS